MRVLGIDPGMRTTGYGCVELGSRVGSPVPLEAGVFSLRRDASMERRLVQLHEDLRSVVTQWRPDAVVLEKLYAHYRHPRTAIQMGHARGVILLAATQASLPVSHLPATEIKKALTGNGHASKEQIQHAVQSLCGLQAPPEPTDVADALAAAVAHAQRVAMTGA